MDVNRRSVMKGAASILAMLPFSGALTASMFLLSCGNIWDDIVSYVGVGLQAFASVVSILSGAGIISIGGGTAINTVIALVQNGFADLKAAVAQYQATVPTNATLAQKVATVLVVLENSIQTFWNNLTIPDAKLAETVAGLLGLIVTALTGFGVQLPAPATVSAINLPKMLTVTPKRMSKHEFIKEFNARLALAGYSQHAIK
jgi:hypothetical protein